MGTSYPIVRLQRERADAKRLKGQKPRFPSKLPYQAQAKRLGGTFDDVARTLSEWEKGPDLSIDPRAVVPERALVFELIGPVAEFELAAQAFGLEWLMSDKPDSSGEDHEDFDGDDESKSASSVLYLTMPSPKGLHKLLAMWARFKANEPPSREEKPFWGVFAYLSDLRTWSAKDRVDPSVAKYIQHILNSDPDRPVSVELDFWYRSEKQKRDGAIATMHNFLKEVGGELIDQVDIPEIRYQGALISIPAGVAKQLSEIKGRLTQLNDVMTIRPQSEYAPIPTEGVEEKAKKSKADEGLAPAMPAPTKRAITAIFDGYPILRHSALNGRVHVHEVDVASGNVPALMRVHGTAMASLVLNGDLLATTPTGLTRPVVAVPILTDTGIGREAIPKNKLAIGVVYRSLQSLIINAETDPRLSDITLINHSVCDTNAPFIRRPSPWAALLDHFSHKHRLLFVVSAGNITSSFPVHLYPDVNAFKADQDLPRQAAILLAIENAKGTRGIFSPAESVNSLTVGALHAEASSNQPQYALDPYPLIAMTNLASAVGFGVNRSVKPDLIEQGGRFAAGASNHRSGHVEVHAHAAVDMGLAVAAPSAIGDLTHTVRTAGTSNSAALITRSCNQIADALDEAFGAADIDWLSLPTRVPMLKALVTHGSSWGEIGGVLEDSFPPSDSKQWSRRRDTIAKFLGFGRPAIERILSGEENRITLLAEDSIIDDERHRYKIPMPAALFNTRDVRSITITLAWTTPIVTTTADYRGVVLKLTKGEGDKQFWKGVERTTINQPNGRTAERGTVTHIRLEGSKKVKSILANDMMIGVQARATHPSQLKEPAPYALAITLEMAQSQKTNLYADVLADIQSRAPAARVPTRVKGKS